MPGAAGLREVTRITLFDYGAGNLHSLEKALAPVGTVRVEANPLAALDTDLLVLPGVGAFGYAAIRIAPALREMRDALAGGLPAIGVCLGMQLLFDESDEADGRGLGVISGRVEKLSAKRIPQIGWNDVEWQQGNGPSTAYFANTFVCKPRDESCVIAWSNYEGERLASAVRVGNTIGVQFHPEKSSAAGVAYLRKTASELIACR